MNKSRRRFIQTTAALGAAMPGTILGANDRVVIGLIGSGSRGSAMGRHAKKNANCTIVASCDVDQGRREAFAQSVGPQCEVYGDYRRVLDRKDIDGVIVATPDHWHSPILIEALQAGKHVYVEKPLSNTVEAAVKMLSAAETHKKVVQVGTMQRSAAHFQEAVKLVRDGGIGQVTQVVVTHPAGGSPDRRMEVAAQPVPQGFDWDMWQGPAPRHPFNVSRARNWRAWYDYGGGSLTDWGIHHVDIVHMALDPDGSNAPLFVGAAANYEFLDNPDRDAVPGTWAVTVRYERFIMSILSCTPAPSGHLIQGPTFWGAKGQLLVNRAGYSVTPVSAYSPYMTNLGFSNRVGAPPPQRPPAAPAQPQAAAGASPGRGPAPAAAAVPGRVPPIGGSEANAGFAGTRRQQEPPITAQETLIENFGRLQGDYEMAHVWNWLDCIRSGQKPIADLPTVFNGHLVCLLAVQSMKEGRALRWDPKARTVTRG